MAKRSGSKKLYGLLGNNISYSLSPAMHNAAFAFFRIDAEYRLFDTEEKDLDGFYEKTLLAGRVRGINVTVPYKVKMKDMLSSGGARFSLDEVASRTGAVNTVSVSYGKLRGFNTDGRGFYESLLEETGFDAGALSNKRFFILGAGGASRAICAYLAAAGRAGNGIFIFDTDKEKLRSLVDAYVSDAGSGGTLVSVDKNDMAEKLGISDVVINATPMGTREDDPPAVVPELLGKTAVVYDLVYCRETELVRAAKERGLKAFNGSGMLVNQAALAFHIWTAMPIGETKKIMREAFNKAIHP